MANNICLYDKKGRHSKFRLLRLYQCLICMEKLKSKDALIEHKITHTDHKPFQCVHCDYKCALKDIMKNHLNIQHSIKVNRNDIITFKKSERLIVDYKCTICAQQFGSKKDFHTHYSSSEICKPFSCQHCNDKARYEVDVKEEVSSITPVEIKNEPVSEEDFEDLETDGPIPSIRDARKMTIYRCMICTKQFQSKSSLYRHNLTHYGSKPFGCTHCEYRSTLRGIMKNHLQIRHGVSMKITDILPDKKDKMFIRAYKCTTCNKILSTKEILQRHLTTNAGCKPFRCLFCDYRSSMKCTMKRHIQGKHGKTVDSSELFLNRKDGVEITQVPKDELDEEEKPNLKIETELSQITPGITIKEESMDYEEFSDIEEKYSVKLEDPTENLNYVETKLEVPIKDEVYLDEGKIQIKVEFDDFKFEQEQGHDVNVIYQENSRGQVP